MRPTRPEDDHQVSILDSLRWQREYVSGAGSPTAAVILDAVAADIRAGGRLAELIPAVGRFGDLPGLRVMAAVHRLALERRAPAVALHLPTLGGSAPVGAARASFGRAVVDVLSSHPEALSDSLARIPQTNEIGRAALLRCALSREDASFGIRLHEIGASAGLNLRPDHLPGSSALEAGPLPPIVDRVGCDLDPVDVRTIEGRALLGSYVWVDDVARFHRLSRAMDIARRVDATLVQMDAEEFIGAITLRPGTITVLWHSAMWVYLAPRARDRILTEVARMAGAAGRHHPFVHVSWEWADIPGSDADFALVVRRWEGGRHDGRPLLVATGMSHGTGITLAEPATWLPKDPLVSPSG